MNFKIPYYGLDRFYKQNKDIILQLTDISFNEGQFLDGAEIKEFETLISSYCNRKYAVTVSSCSDALYFSLLSLNIGFDDEVLLPSFSFIATLNSVLRTGATPVFLDVDNINFTISLEEIKQKRTAKTKALILVPLFGLSYDYTEIELWCKKENIFVIEDAAQAIGTMYNGKPSGSWGELSCLSFDPSKIIHAFGTGGAILTNNEQLYYKLKRIRYQGKEKDDFIEKGFNSRISTLQAKLLLWQMDNIEKIVEKRQKIAQKYFSELAEINKLSFPVINSKVFPTYHKFVIFSRQRDKLKSYLQQNGIQTFIHYPKLLFEYSLMKDCFYKAENIAQANDLCKKVLSLPLYPELTEEEIQFICKIIKSFYL
jgi:dTDP-4-amino-4,6-dideoxygalactose transaminase